MIRAALNILKYFNNVFYEQYIKYTYRNDYYLMYSIQYLYIKHWSHKLSTSVHFFKLHFQNKIPLNFYYKFDYYDKFPTLHTFLWQIYPMKMHSKQLGSLIIQQQLRGHYKQKLRNSARVEFPTWKQKVKLIE